MIVLLRHDADDGTVRAVADAIRKLGLDVTSIDHVKGRAFEVLGPDRGRVLELRRAPGVEEILTRRTALEGGEPVWPHFALRVAVVTLWICVALVLLSALLPPGLGDRAQPGASGVAVEDSVEWYLRPLAGFLRILPRAGGVLTLGLWLAFMFWPFLDRTRRRRTHALVRVLGIALIVLVVALALGPVQ